MSGNMFLQHSDLLLHVVYEYDNVANIVQREAYLKEKARVTLQTGQTLPSVGSLQHYTSHSSSIYDW